MRYQIATMLAAIVLFWGGLILAILWFSYVLASEYTTVVKIFLILPWTPMFVLSITEVAVVLYRLSLTPPR